MTHPAPSASSSSACLHPHPDDASRLIADIPSPCVQNHAANLMPLPNGDLACVWFGGSQEGKSDISIYFSRLPAGKLQNSAPTTRPLSSTTRRRAADCSNGCTPARRHAAFK